jgi:hypothetical protein
MNVFSEGVWCYDANMRKSHKIIIALGIVTALAAAGAIYAYPRVTRFFDIDGCLDSGGAWHNEKCIYSLDELEHQTQNDK